MNINWKLYSWFTHFSPSPLPSRSCDLVDFSLFDLQISWAKSIHSKPSFMDTHSERYRCLVSGPQIGEAEVSRTRTGALLTFQVYVWGFHWNFVFIFSNLFRSQTKRRDLALGTFVCSDRQCFFFFSDDSHGLSSPYLPHMLSHHPFNFTDIQLSPLTRVCESSLESGTAVQARSPSGDVSVAFRSLAKKDTADKKQSLSWSLVVCKYRER